MAMRMDQAIRDAIESERAAARFYQRLHDRTMDPRAQKFLAGMVAEEERHATFLEEIAARRDLALPDGTSPLVEVIETAPAWSDVEDIDLQEALEIAREAETQACMYYDALADHVTGDLAAFFRDMSRTEEQHMATVQRMQAELAARSGD